MNKKFGDKRIFSFEYEIIDGTYGALSMWIRGKNICLYSVDGIGYICECDLYHIADWFYEKLEYILGYDPFPLPVRGKTVLECISEADKYDDSDEFEFDVWYGAKSRWIFNHCWFSVRAGAILPCVYFQRKEAEVEVSWDNMFWHEDKVAFQQSRGCMNVPYKNFKQVLFEFMETLIRDIKDICPKTDFIDKGKNDLLFNTALSKNYRK